LAGPVLAYLAAFTEAPARNLEERFEKLQRSVESWVKVHHFVFISAHMDQHRLTWWLVN